MSAAKQLYRNLRKSKSSYRCPKKECGKSYKSFTGMKVHLYKYHCDIFRESDKGKETCKNDVLMPAARIIKNHSDVINCTDNPETFEINIDGHLSFLNSSEPIPVMLLEDLDQNSLNDNLNSPKTCKYSNCASPKFPEPSFHLLENHSPPTSPQLPEVYYKFPEGLFDELDKEVEYDMDDEDVIWLSLINEQLNSRKLTKVSEDTFELLMDRLEKESFAQAQAIAEDALASLDEDAVCCICNDGECDDSNAILFCDLCNLPVHQECYGVPFIPEGQWLCRPCGSSTSSPAKCVLCPNKGGALKPTDDNRWAHVICALWIPEVGFTNPNFLEPIDSLHKIPRARWKLCCYICKQKNAGACIQCKKNSCYTAFHVTCAQGKGLFMEMKAIRSNGSSDLPYEIIKSAYCHLHTPAEPCSEESSHEDSNDKEDHKNQTLTELSVPVTSIPDIAPNKLIEIARSFDIPVDRFFFEKLLGYWKLKRQARGGAPLLRRLQITLHSKQKESSEAENEPLVKTPVKPLLKDEQLTIKHVKKVRQDFEKARLLLEMIRKREKLKKRLIQIKEQETLLRLQPFKAILLKVLESLQKKDLNQIFCQPVDLCVAPDYLDFIKNPMDFSTMKDKILKNQYSSFRQFVADFNLIIDNCLFYNSPETIYHKIALEVKEQCVPILQRAKNEILRKGLDVSTGLFQHHMSQVTKFNSKNDLKSRIVNCINIKRSSQDNNRLRKYLREDSNCIQKNFKARKSLLHVKSRHLVAVPSRMVINESDEENGIRDMQLLRKSVKKKERCHFRTNSINVTRKCQRNSYKLKFHVRQSRNSDASMPVVSTNTSVPKKLSPVLACVPAEFSPSTCPSSNVEICTLGDSSPLKVPMKTSETECVEGELHEKRACSLDRQLRKKKLT